MSIANSWVEVVELALFGVSFVAAWWHLDCDHPGCFRVPGTHERYCRRHQKH